MAPDKPPFVAQQPTRYLILRDRLTIDGNVIFVTSWNLSVSFISTLFQPENVAIFVKMAYGRRAATGSPLVIFL